MPDPSLSLQLLLAAGGRALIVIWKVNWITTRQCQSGAGKHDSAILLMVATSTTFQPSSDSDLLLSTDYLECHKKFLMTVCIMTVLLWQYDSLQPGPRMWLHHYDSMTDSMPSSDRAARKLGHPAKLLLKSGHPKTRMLPFTPPFWSRPCIGLLLCSWNVTWPFNWNQIKSD